ncbi:hypothetical protein [Streptomyces sp. NPDC086010]|uniref:hypothetical protein n=1 Tax=Streptomyces sp. NPDC086010 TaxID=3365745 RepID=UPI0037D2A268
MKKKLARTLLATVVALCATSCSSGDTGEQGGAMKGEADYETYATVEDLTIASEAAYQVKIGQEVSRECDDGGDAAGDGGEPTSGPEDSDPEDASPAPSVSPPPSGIAGGQAENADCLPMIFYQADIITEIYQGVAARGEVPVPLGKIIVGTVDTSKIDLEGASPLKPGSYVVIYGDELTPAEHPGITTVAEDLWTPTGGDQGIFDTDASGATVTARSSSVKALTDETTEQRATSSDKFTTSVSALKEVASSVQKG